MVLFVLDMFEYISRRKRGFKSTDKQITPAKGLAKGLGPARSRTGLVWRMLEMVWVPSLSVMIDCDLFPIISEKNKDRLLNC